MKTIKLCKTEAGFDALDNWYRRFYDRLPYPAETRRVETSFGFTEVVLTGPQEGEPLVVLHGAMAGAPHALGELTDLPARQRMIAINIPGQSVRAAQVRLTFKNDEYARWLLEVFDALDLQSPRVAAVSWGGSVALHLAKFAPDRIAGLLLVVPGSVVRGPAWKGFTKIGLPMMRYSLSPSPRNLQKALRHIMTSEDELWTPYLGEALLLFNKDFSIPPLVKPSDLEGFHAPVFVIAADGDLSFPGVKLLQRAEQIFNNLAGTHLLENSQHSPSFLDEDRRAFTKIFEQGIVAIR
jgi:2-hydroxy-6-oxonona-2,4-dienedioate hydrolase